MHAIKIYIESLLKCILVSNNNLLHHCAWPTVMAADAAAVVSFTLLHSCAFSCCCRRVTSRHVTLPYVTFACSYECVCVCAASNCKI